MLGGRQEELTTDMRETDIKLAQNSRFSYFLRRKPTPVNTLLLVRSSLTESFK